MVSAREEQKQEKTRSLKQENTPADKTDKNKQPPAPKRAPSARKRRDKEESSIPDIQAIVLHVDLALKTKLKGKILKDNCGHITHYVLDALGNITRQRSTDKRVTYNTLPSSCTK